MVLQHESHSAELGLYHCASFAVNPLNIWSRSQTQQSRICSDCKITGVASLYPFILKRTSWMDVKYKKTHLFKDTISRYCNGCNGENPQIRKKWKNQKRANSNSKLGKPRRTHASIISKYSTLCNSPISSTKNSFSTSHPKNRFEKKIPPPHKWRSLNYQFSN